MKHRLLPFLLAVIAGAAILTACSSNPETQGQEAVNRVYPEGEGRYFQPTSEADVTGADTTAAQTTAATKPSTTAATTAPSSTAATKATVPATTAPLTQPTTIRTDVPNDEITAANINPNIDAIQRAMQEQVYALAVRSISLSQTSLTLETGESKKLQISINPSNAANKICTISTDNGNARAVIEGQTVTVTGVNAGTCTLTVTSNNGHTAKCDITVKRVEQQITDDTVLTHKELVTAANAERWTELVAARLEGLGMSRNTSLQGDSFTLTTEGENNKSFNESAASFTSAAESQAATLIAHPWAEYEFNVVCKALDDGEYAIVTAINQISTEEE